MSHSITIPPPMLPISSILLMLLSHCAFAATRKNAACILKMLLLQFLFKQQNMSEIS